MAGELHQHSLFGHFILAIFYLLTQFLIYCNDTSFADPTSDPPRLISLADVTLRGESPLHERNVELCLTVVSCDLMDNSFFNTAQYLADKDAEMGDNA